MKTGFSHSLSGSLSLLLVVAPALCPALLGQQAEERTAFTRLENDLADGVYRPVELGPHHRVMQRITEAPDEAGFMQPRTNSYVELSTAMHVWSQAEQKWIPADDEIEILEDRAVARKSKHQVTFAGNLNDPNGTVDLLTLDGKRLRSRVLGLAYTDADTGRSVFIGEAKDSQGFVLGRNQVLYVDALEGEPAIKVDVRYRTTIHSFEQDVIVREQLPDPTFFDLNPEKTRLEVWTEFLEAPVPQKQARTFQRIALLPEVDELLDFGATQIGIGRAFTLEENNAEERRDPADVLITKTWEVLDGTSFLIESVPYLEIKPQIDALPRPQADLRRGRSSANLLAARAEKGRSRPISQRPSPATGTLRLGKPRMLVAGVRTPQRGLVLDYVTLNSNQSGYNFRGDSTYHITGAVTISGNCVIEGGSVLKFNKYVTWGDVQLLVTGTLDCRTSAYRPAICTAKDDDTVGERISDSTGSPTGWHYGWYQLWCAGAQNYDVHDVHFRFAHIPVYYVGSTGESLIRHAQFHKCFATVYADGHALNAQNILCSDCDDVMRVRYGGIIRGQHLTVNKALFCPYYANGTNDGTVYLTNSLLVEITYTNIYTGINNQTASSGSGVFQTAGAGAHYLVAGSSHRNAGTAAINSTLLDELKKKTTYPPITLSGPIAANTTLSPQAQRDNDTPDLGYHYNPLDWCISNLSVSATLTLTNGVALGIYDTNGFALQSGSKLVSQGSPVNLNRIVRYQNVQEQPTLWGATNSMMTLVTAAAGASPMPEVNLRFTHVPFLAIDPVSDKNHFFRNASNDRLGTLTLMDCQFDNAVMHLVPAADTSRSTTVGLTNTVFDRGLLRLAQANTDNSPLEVSSTEQSLPRRHAGFVQQQQQPDGLDGP